jgi:hypothetical protein
MYVYLKIQISLEGNLESFIPSKTGLLNIYHIISPWSTLCDFYQHRRNKREGEGVHVLYIYKYIYIHIRTYIHTHTHTHRRTCVDYRAFALLKFTQFCGGTFHKYYLLKMWGTSCSYACGLN